MMRRILIAIALVLVMAAGASADWKEGLWEITSKVDMPGMPKDMPPTTMKQCITKKDLTPMPTNKSQGTECTRKEQKLSGDTVTYLVECKNKDGSVMEGAGTMKFKGDTFEGTSTTTMTRKGQAPMKMNGKMSGKYLGPCTK